MSYFLLTVIIWLLQGAPTIDFRFSPIFVAFLIAIIADVYHFVPLPWPKKAA